VFKVEPGDSGWTKWWKGLNAFLSLEGFATATVKQFDGQKYPNAMFPSRHFSGGGVDDEYKSADHIFSQMCIQSLAFSKWKDFGEICEKAVLESVFAKPQLSVNYAATYHKFKANTAENQAGRICAFRNFYRNNYVHQLTVGQKR
jgi:hypothetical protein